MKRRMPEVRTRTISVCLLSVLVLMAAACGGDDRQNTGEPANLAPGSDGTPVDEIENSGEGDPVSGDGDRLEGTEWMATSIKGEDVLSRFPSPTLRFDSADRVSGSAGCNEYGGMYKVTGSEITFTVGPTTRRACLKQQAEQEGRFLESLQEAADYEVRGDEMTLTDTHRALVVSFEEV
jgi:heat shock protein HslJ